MKERLKAAALHVARLVGPGLAYIGRTLLDLGSLARAGYLRYARRKHPERATDIDANLAGLRGRRSARWVPWAALPALRKLEIRVAALVIAAIAVAGVRAYVIAAREAAPPVYGAGSGQVAYEREAARLTEAGREETRRQIEEAKARERALKALAERDGDEQFRKAVKAAAPGQWIVHRSSAAAQRRAITPVLLPGEPGQWDDLSVASPAVMKDGNRLRMWYVGCRFDREEYSCGIGHAESSDGLAWRKSPGPVLAIPDAQESQYLHSIAVARAGDEYLLWYASDSDPMTPDHCALLNLATSKDGLAWKPQGVVLRTNCERTAHLWPSVFNDGKMLHLWYVDRDSVRGLVHLTSTDGRKWQPATASFDKVSDQGRISVTGERAGAYRALFASRSPPWRFEALRSSDLDTWEVATEKLPVSDAVFSRGRPEAPAALLDSSGLWMWFAFRDTGVRPPTIALAFEKEEAR